MSGQGQGQVPPNTPQMVKLRDHTKLFLPAKRYTIGTSVYCFVGWNLANITFVDTANGLVVVDTGEDIAQMKAVWEAFTGDTEIPAETRGKKVHAVLLTHHHADHVGGTSFLLDKFVDPNNPLIIGAHNLDSEYQQENGLIMPLMSCRAMAQYNSLLAQNFPLDVQGLNSGIGPIITQNVIGYVKPNRLVALEPYVLHTHILPGFTIVYVPSEANSEIAAYLPDLKVLLSAEVIQDHSFPNLYTLRGANFRDPSNWVQSIDTFITKFADAQHMVLQHGPPIINNADHSPSLTDPRDMNTYPIAEVLTRYRDAIKFVRDQTLRWAMKGYAKEEIMQIVSLPEDQQNFRPWLQPFYGNIKHCIPAIYTGYIGWFDGDPIALQPLPRSKFSERMVEFLGGINGVMEKANAAFNLGTTLASNGDIEGAKTEWQFAAELATYIIRMKASVDNPQSQSQSASSSGHGHGHGHSHVPKHLLHPEDSKDEYWHTARRMKAECFRQLAYRTECANWFGTYLTAAHELEGSSLVSMITNQMKNITLLTCGGLDVSQTLDELAIRLDPSKAYNIPSGDAVVYLVVSGTGTGAGSAYRLEIRNGVLVPTALTTEQTPPDGSTVITGSNRAINLLLNGDTPKGYDGVLEDSSMVTVTPTSTGLQHAKAFFGYFDGGRFSTPPNIYLH